MARFCLDGFVSNRFGRTFPFGILAINVIGSFVIGFLFAFIGPQGRVLVNPTVRGFFMVGICGGFTTFSSFSLNTLNLAQEGQWGRAALNVAANVVLCLLAVWMGYLLGSVGGTKTGG
jgi:CrcB protein